VSLHKSLVARNKLVRARNVLTRAERIERLRQDGRFTDGTSVFGLPKVKALLKAKPKKKKKEEAEEGTETETETETEETASE
jgi:small basic protein (TIGR04137 family)